MKHTRQRREIPPSTEGEAIEEWFKDIGFSKESTEEPSICLLPKRRRRRQGPK